MKILLKNVQTGLFYVRPEHWTPQESEAHHFRSGDQAVFAAIKCRQPEMATLYLFNDPSLSFAIPIPVTAEN